MSSIFRYIKKYDYFWKTVIKDDIFLFLHVNLYPNNLDPFWLWGEYRGFTIFSKKCRFVFQICPSRAQR